VTLLVTWALCGTGNISALRLNVCIRTTFITGTIYFSQRQAAYRPDDWSQVLAEMAQSRVTVVGYVGVRRHQERSALRLRSWRYLDITSMTVRVYAGLAKVRAAENQCNITFCSGFPRSQYKGSSDISSISAFHLTILIILVFIIILSVEY
jgi:hypothetical protein